MCLMVNGERGIHDAGADVCGAALSVALLLSCSLALLLSALESSCPCARWWRRGVGGGGVE
jgi:hypothetical protein